MAHIIWSALVNIIANTSSTCIYSLSFSFPVSLPLTTSTPRQCRSQYSLFSHLVYDHLPLLPSYPHQCLWRGCPSSSVKRMRPSLMTHLQVKHNYMYTCYITSSLGPLPAPLCMCDTQNLRFSWASLVTSCWCHPSATRSVQFTHLCTCIYMYHWKEQIAWKLC